MLKTTKRTTVLLTAAMSLGIAAPAGAMPFNTDAQGSLVPVEITPPAVQSVAPSGGGGGISDLGYVGIGTGAVAIALIGARNGRKPSQDQDDAAPGASTPRHRSRRRLGTARAQPPSSRTTPSQPAVQIARVSAPGGFDWSDAGIGAAGALGLSTLTIGSGLVIAARRRRTSGRADPGLHATPHQGDAGQADRGALEVQIRFRPTGGNQMTHARTTNIAAGILGLVLTIAVAFSTSAVPASARTFNFNSAGSMVQQPLPPQWACAISRALNGRSSACRKFTDR